VADASDDATCFLEEVCINKRVPVIKIMKKKHLPIDGCSAGILIMATRDGAWPTKHGQKTLVCCRDITVTKEGAVIGEIFFRWLQLWEG
jgi:hypothetical protein